MNVRPLLLAALALGFAAGCSKPASTPPTPSNEPGTPTAGDSKQPSTPAAPSSDQSGTPVPPSPQGNNTEVKMGESAVYIVKDSGIRCIAPPCPSYNAFLADKPDMDAIPIHDLDLSAVAGGSEQQMEQLMQRTVSGGLKIRGVLEVKPKAGPAGDATILRATQVE